jgi:hypothetical protein
MTKDEALKLALEALEGVLDDAPKVLDASIAGGLYEVVQCRDAITAIKEALAQPEQEPKCGAIIEVFGKDWRLEYLSLPVGKHKLYTQQYTYTTPEQEPVAFEKTVCPFCTSEWVTAEQHDRNVDRVERKPLTDEEIMNIAKVSCIGISPQEDTLNFAKVIEAVHGIKGEA